MNIVKFEEIENKIIDIRGQKAILDSDVAYLYGVETRDREILIKPSKIIPTNFQMIMFLNSIKQSSEVCGGNFPPQSLPKPELCPKPLPRKGCIC